MLPQCHKNVFNYLMAFLQEMLKYSAHNRLDVSILGRLTMHFHYLFSSADFESTGQFQWKAELKRLFYTKHIQYSVKMNKMANTAAVSSYCLYAIVIKIR